MRRRHRFIVLSFLFYVLVPVLVATWYLHVRAADQFASRAAFAVRTEESQAGFDVLSGLSAISGSSSKDTDILDAYLSSQDLVERVADRIDLAAMWSKPDDDVVFAYRDGGTIEDLHRYWQRQVHVLYDNRTGLIDLRVTAFDPEDATQIATVALDEASALINRLSDVAQRDMIRSAQQELERSENRLRAARLELAELRSSTGIVDPLADLEGDMELLSGLQEALTEEMVQLNILRSNMGSKGTKRRGANDVRMQQSEIRINVLKEQIAEERRKFGGSPEDGLTGVVGQFESLGVEVRFAEQAYVSASAALDLARAEAHRKSRYLAVFIEPTRAERADYPRRAFIGFACFFGLFLIWALGLLIYYSLRDRRGV